VLIAKSNGLPHLYHEFLLKDRHARLVRESGERSTVAGNSLRWIAKRAAGGLKAVEKSIATADLVHLLNRDEVAFVRDRLGYGKKCVLVPNGLSDELAAALAISTAAGPFPAHRYLHRGIRDTTGLRRARPPLRGSG
jgi:hypothetical protein